MDEKQKVVNEVPEILKKLTLFLIKTFYGTEHFIVADYIQRRLIIKEDVLRDILKIDQKYLRQLLVPLKVDKFVKERLVLEEVDGRSRKVNYYFINYKAVMNVTKYKLDHMRQKLESKEKDEVHRTAYQCTNDSCKKQYDDMDVGKIYNHVTTEMRCWQCGHLVDFDDTAGPSKDTRTSLASFNEQTAGLFSMLQNLDGIRFALEVLEPPIPSTDSMEDNQKNNEERFLRVGERAFNALGKTRSELYGSGITVSIGDEVEQVPEAKEAVPWLQDRQQPTDHNPSMLLNDLDLAVESLLGISNSIPSTSSTPNLTSYNDNTTSSNGPAAKRSKREDIASILMEEEGHAVDTKPRLKQISPENKNSTLFNTNNGNQSYSKNEIVNNNEDVDEDVYVTVQGKKILLDDVNDEIISQMTPEEKQTYIDTVQNNFDYYF